MFELYKRTNRQTPEQDEIRRKGRMCDIIIVNKFKRKQGFYAIASLKIHKTSILN